MTAPNQKTVNVLNTATGPTGLFERVNIVPNVTGPTGAPLPVWLSLTGASGGASPNGTFKTVINVGPTGVTGSYKNVTILGYTGSAGGGASSFNPADINANAALSNANLTVTGVNASNGGVRGTKGYSSGKVVIGFTNVTVTDNLDYLGVGTLLDTLGLASGTQDQAIMCGQPGNAFTSFSDGTLGTVNPPTLETSWGANCSLDLALDLVNNKFWWRYNGGGWFGSNNTTANPATNTAGWSLGATTIGKTLYPYVRVTTASAHMTLNPNPTNLPAGFSAWG